MASRTTRSSAGVGGGRTSRRLSSTVNRHSKRSKGLVVTTKNSQNILLSPTPPAMTHHVTSTTTATDNNTLLAKQAANTSRKKRHHDDGVIIAAAPDPPIKRARYAVEIESKPIVLHASAPPTFAANPKPKARSVIINSNATNDLPPSQQASHEQLAPQLPRATPASTIQPRDLRPTQTSHLAEDSEKSTIHHQKVANGIKHELDRLQPSEAITKDEKRKLRSQEGTRFKSELSLYFPEYDEVIGNDPKEDHILNLDTPIIIIDSAKPVMKTPIITSTPSGNTQKSEYPLKRYANSLFTTLTEAQRVDFSFLDSHCKDTDKNPLPNSFFENVHKKPERHEKVIRNTDKGRAQHEKDQVIRLLEGLQGHDWLKLMGVSGITDSRKKDFEPARDHFIKGCLAIIEKFKTWREEEKRRRMEKEQAATAGAEAEDDENDDDSGNVSDGDPPDYSDVDASAARQLHEEAIARSAPMAPAKRPKPKASEPPLPVCVEEKEFTSFFSKPYLREAALHKHRRSGRSVSAWGQPVPELAEECFDLPEEYRDEETLKVHARKKRRDRRISKE
ncbi:hypothetical protein BP6252_07088 [Coleophoma cylindrospora]|uniref:Something about silencing protein 4 domain-containing protein n=1 Tax=Coleophoma cylindrospora TaxID=1849047 RepID=A0A3D8RH46_9HELO|nr:hypothetical protein BP6252_07088 [Coleophoma cylindrospora]